MRVQEPDGAMARVLAASLSLPLAAAFASVKTPPSPPPPGPRTPRQPLNIPPPSPSPSPPPPSASPEQPGYIPVDPFPSPSPSPPRHHLRLRHRQKHTAMSHATGRQLIATTGSARTWPNTASSRRAAGAWVLTGLPAERERGERREPDPPALSRGV